MKVIFTHSMVAYLAMLFMFLYMADKLGAEQAKSKQVHYKLVYIDQWGQAYDFIKEK